MDRHQDVTALLANRLKPLSRVAPRDSFASDSYSLEDSSPVPLQYAEDDDRRSTSHRQHHHPFSAQTHLASEDEDSYVDDADDSQESQLRMSVLGPKIHKNGNAPWEEMDGLAEEPEDYDRPSTPATSIFGKRPKHGRKSSTSTTSGLRQRSKTVVEALSPVGALKGLGFAVGATSASSAPNSGRSSRNNSFAPSLSKQPRPSFQSQSSSLATSGPYDDDRRSVNTVVDGYHQQPSFRQRSRSRPRQETTYADGTIPIDLTSRDSSFSTSSSSFSEDESSRPPLPRTGKGPLRIATDVHNSHHSHNDSIVRPEDVFRTSVVSTTSEYGQRLHPYLNVDMRSSPTSPKAPSGFSSEWASSPSTLEPSRSPGGTGGDSQSPDSWLDSPSGYGRSAAGFFDRSRNGTTPSPNTANNRSTSSSSSRKKPPPLSLHPSMSSTSLSTLAKGGSGGLVPPPPLPTTPVSPSTASGITRSPTPNTEAYRSEDISTTKPLNITRKPVPQQQTDSSEHQSGAFLTPRSNSNPPTMGSTAESSLPFPSTPQQQQTADDVPPGMLVFPGSPAYGLISLEQAQAKVRGSGLAGRSLSGDVKGKKEGLGGFVARMRLGSEDKAAALGGSAEGSISPSVGPAFQQDNSAKTSGGCNTSTATATNARQPVLRQRKSGFLKIFGGGGDKTPAPPLPTSPMPRNPATMISSPMPVGVTDDGLPSPFIAGEAATRKPMVLKDIVGRQGSFSSPSPQPPARQSNASSSPPQSFQGRPSVNTSSKSSSRLKETGLTGFEGASPSLGDEEIVSRERSGTTSTVHSPQYEIGPKDESIRSDLSTMGGAEDDAAAENRRMMLKLRHVSATNFLSSLPSGYLSQPYPGATTTASSSTLSSTLNNSMSTSSDYQFSTSSSSASRPSVSASSDGPATSSFNSLLTSSSSNWVSSSVYASSESSSSIAASPLPVTPHSGGTGTMAHQQQMSMMSLVSPTPTQSSFLSSPGRTPQQQPFVDVRNSGGDGMSTVIATLQDELAATRKQMRQQAVEMERMRAELEALRKEKEEAKVMTCRSCGGRDAAPRSTSSESAGEAGEPRLTGIVNRPRAPTGSGGRFGNRMV